MSNSDRIALDSVLPPGSKTHELFRAVCGVCDRHGWDGFMGFFDFDEAEPEQWFWLKPRHRMSKRSVTPDDDRRSVFVRRGGIGMTPALFGFSEGLPPGISMALPDLWDCLRAPLKPRCDTHNHQLRVLSSEDVISLIERARAAGRDWVVIPE